MQTIASLIPGSLAAPKTTAESPKSASSGWRPTLDEWHPSLTVAADDCARFVADMERGAEPYWLTLQGSLGSGKTMLARQLFTEARRCNPGDQVSVWVTGSGIYDEDNRRPRRWWFTAAQFRDRMLGGEYDLPEYLRSDYLVIVDDLGAARETRNDALADGLYRLADNRSHRWMVWTTNLTLAEISTRLDPRISSRIIRDDNKLVSITACDYALRRGAP